MGVNILKFGEVKSLFSPYEDGRIKVWIPNDGNSEIGEENYAFPLLPKTIQTIPKVGETVLIILSHSENRDSNRFYIGPVITQLQDMENSPYSEGVGKSMAGFVGQTTEMHQALRYHAETDGAFPKENDVAIIGRYGEDIILRENEIELRAGVRVKKSDLSKNDAEGKSLESKRVWFNKTDPAFIQVRYQQGLNTRTDKAQDANGVINLVADKINIISHKEKENYKVEFPNPKDMIGVEELEKVMDQLYRVPYGEVLRRVLITFKNAIMTHWHEYPYESPSINGVASMEALNNENFTDLLSNHVRIS